MSKLPNAFCLGAQKCGTTTLANILREHPEIFVPEAKEPHFFDRNFHKGLAYYERKFFRKAKPEHVIRIDFTPINLYRSAIAKEIHGSLGQDLKLFVILRDPARRAYSQYQMSKRKGHEVLTFEESLSWGSQDFGSEYRDRVNSYIPRGYYHKQIGEYLKYFDPEQLHIMIFEDFVADPKKEIETLLDFLGVDSSVPLDYGKKSNESHPIRSVRYARWISSLSRVFYEMNFRPKILIRFKRWLHGFNRMDQDQVKKPAPPDFRKINNRFYKEEIRQLSRLLGRDLSQSWEVDLEEVS